MWLSNGLAKLIDKGTYDWGFISLNLITRGSAQFIADDASHKTYIAPLGAFYQNVVLPNWGFFGAFLTVAELAVGLGLLFGVATRLAAVGGLLLIGPIWLMLLHTGGYLMGRPPLLSVQTIMQIRWWSAPQRYIAAVVFVLASVVIGEVGETLAVSAALIGLIAATFVRPGGRRALAGAGSGSAGAIVMACPVCSPLATPLLGTGGRAPVRCSARDPSI